MVLDYSGCIIQNDRNREGAGEGFLSAFSNRDKNAEIGVGVLSTRKLKISIAPIATSNGVKG